MKKHFAKVKAQKQASFSTMLFRSISQSNERFCGEKAMFLFEKINANISYLIAVTFKAPTSC